VILRRARSFFALPAEERALALRAIWIISWWRVAVHFLTVDRIRRKLEATPRRQGIPTAAAVRRAVTRATRTIPGSSCLVQSLAAEELLRSGGLDALLTIGVASGTAGARLPLDAHAWVQSGGLVVAGDAPLERYRELVTFGTRA
jgi:hypothetical protein